MESRQRALELDEKRRAIEKEIDQQRNILAANGVGMSDPLVDAEGFPLSAVDVYQVRHARQKIICALNDHKRIMKSIEEEMYGYYSETSSTNVSSQPMEVCSNGTAEHHIPFLTISDIAEESPSDFAGWQNGDQVLEFGSINSTNCTGMETIANLVQHSDGQEIRVGIFRNGQTMSTRLRPKKWRGRGLLGCKIDLIS